MEGRTTNGRAKSARSSSRTRRNRTQEVGPPGKIRAADHWPDTTRLATGEPGGATPRVVNHHEIGARAYEIYLTRGEEPGYDLDDWLRAERELCFPGLQS